MTEKKETAPARKVVATTLDMETFARFEEIAWQKRHRRNADAIREAINEYIEKHGNVSGGAAPSSKR